MRKVFGILLTLLGISGFGVFLYVGYNGKYGIRQFMSSFPDRLDMGAIPIGIGALAFLIWGLLLLFSKKSVKELTQ